LKTQVFARYGIKDLESGYHVDRLVPIKLGGANSPDNLWPQPLSGEWCWARKNRLERRLHKLICHGTLDLKVAQREIALNWIEAYKKYIGEPRQNSDQP
jgi:hypothetical protein